MGVNQIATVEDATAYPLVIQVLAGIKRNLVCPTTKKEPIMPEILSTLVSKFGQQDASLSDIHTLCAYLLGFAGFFYLMKYQLAVFLLLSCRLAC